MFQGDPSYLLGKVRDVTPDDLLQLHKNLTVWKEIESVYNTKCKGIRQGKSLLCLFNK